MLLRFGIFAFIFGLVRCSLSEPKYNKDGSSILSGEANFIPQEDPKEGAHEMAHRADNSVIAGGQANYLSGNYASIGGGGSNVAWSNFATVIGGFNNKASGRFSAVLGGSTNTAQGRYALAAGYKAKAKGINSAAFGFRNNVDRSCVAAGDNEFRICAQKIVLDATTIEGPDGPLRQQSGASGPLKAAIDDKLECNDAKMAGTIRFAADSNSLEVCTGDKWKELSFAKADDNADTKLRFVSSDAKCGSEPGAIRLLVDKEEMTTHLQMCHGSLHADDNAIDWIDINVKHHEKAKGGTVSAKGCGGKTCHIFRSSGDFTLNTASKAEVLVVGGGGGAGGCNSGGGGAGGLLFGEHNLQAGTYKIVIGNGGAGNSGRTLGSNGEDTSMKGPGFERVAKGGGAGSDSYGHKAGKDGGSGGGAFDPPGAGGKGTSGQGNDGGTGKLGNSPHDKSSYRMGGGGGAGGKGNTNDAGAAFQGHGGKGKCFSQFEKVAGVEGDGCFAGGGAAGCHGAIVIDRSRGGGGKGCVCAKTDRTADGVDGTGGGGGGSICGETCDPGGKGGTGIVIIRLL